MAKKTGKRETPERQPRERKSRKQVNPPGSAGDSSESSGGADGCEMGVAGRTVEVEGRNGGTLTPHPPGSNGGVHRGPARFPGRNIVRSVFVTAMAAEGLSVADLRRRRKHRRGSSLIPLAMAEHCKQGYKNIAIDAALGKPEAYGPFLRMMADAHTMLQPAKDEVARAQDRVPMPATFIRAPAAAAPDAESSPPARPTAPATGPLDGYVEA